MTDKLDTVVNGYNDRINTKSMAVLQVQTESQYIMVMLLNDIRHLLMEMKEQMK